MEGMSILRELLKAIDWMVMIDLKDVRMYVYIRTYFTIPMVPFFKAHGKSKALSADMPPIYLFCAT